MMFGSYFLCSYLILFFCIFPSLRTFFPHSIFLSSWCVLLGACEIEGENEGNLSLLPADDEKQNTQRINSKKIACI